MGLPASNKIDYWPNRKRYAQLVRIERESLGMNAREYWQHLAKIMDRSPGTLKSYSGDRTQLPAHELIEQFARHFRVPYEELARPHRADEARLKRGDDPIGLAVDPPTRASIPATDQAVEALVAQDRLRLLAGMVKSLEAMDHGQLRIAAVVLNDLLTHFGLQTV